MKKLLRITRKILISLLILVIVLLVILISNYIIEDNKLKKADKALAINTHTRLIQSDTSDISARLPLKLLPVPQKMLILEGFYQMPENPTYFANDSLRDDIDSMLLKFPEISAVYSKMQGDIMIAYNRDLQSEGYRMEILPGRISIEFSDLRGLYYALVSLKVLDHNHNGLLPCVTIEDYPDLDVRGLMLDISRDKIPTFETLCHLVEVLADLKYNHLQLYIEGFSFDYPSFSYLRDSIETPLTGDEIRDLDRFCTEHYIELVPNQNSLGHMAAWLASDEYADLAECPDGYKFMGLLEMKSTIDPSDPRSIELVTRMTDDLLPNFSSGKFNVNLDEPFELGKGKNKKLAEEYGLGEVYLNYTLKIHDLVTRREKEMLMWGDIVLRQPELLDKLPKDITLLDWGYESSYPFERNSRLLQKSGMNYVLCPGTSSWTSIAGRTDNMLGNIASATANALKYGARGMLLTDWGDMGHWQYLPVSYAGYVTGGALSWNSKSFKMLPLTSFLNDYIFKDNRQIMGQLVLDLGRYMQFEEIPVPNMTTTMLSLQLGLNDRILTNAIYGAVSEGMTDLMKDFAPEMVNAYLETLEKRQPFDFSGLFTFLDEKEALLDNVILNTPEGELVKDEYRNLIRLIRVGAHLQFYIEKKSVLSAKDRSERLTSLRNELINYLSENHRLWMSRNKPGGYLRSTSALTKLLDQIEQEMEINDQPMLRKSLSRIKTMITASLVALYLRII